MNYSLKREKLKAMRESNYARYMLSRVYESDATSM